MIFPDVSVEVWCKKHDIKVKNLECPKCGFIQETTIPFITQECVGLMAPLHECGKQYQAATSVSRDPIEREKWKDFAKLLINHMNGIIT
jgi:hypothetical protein